MSLTRDSAVKKALVYLNAGKFGHPMPEPIKGKELGCKGAYQMGEFYMLLEHKTKYENMAALKNRLCNESNK